MEHAVDTSLATTSRVTTVRVVYLARLREVLECASETLPVASDAKPSVADVVRVLRARGGVWAHELGAGRAVRIAVNQQLARSDTPIADGDEVAVFPPVTGG